MDSRRPATQAPTLEGSLHADRLSGLLESFPLRAGVFHSGSLCGTYSFDRDVKPGHFHIMRTGRLELIGADQRQQWITEPSVIFMPDADTHALVADPGTEVLCATVRFGSGSCSPVIGSMPTSVVVPLAEAGNLNALCDLMFEEAASERTGRQASLNRLCELSVVSVLRHCLETGLLCGGTLAGLTDTRLSKALVEMHRQPGREWPLHELAALAGMSRARFAARFLSVVGVTPGDHLVACRVVEAQQLLRQGWQLKQVADKVGYGSAGALTRAFTRTVGSAPSFWRANATQAPGTDSKTLGRETKETIDRDIASIARISAVPLLLRVICDFTGMGFAAVARVSDQSWTACAVLDRIGFGLKPGDQLDLHTTLCVESRAARTAVSFDHASQDSVYRDHHTPRIYKIESYISVPILRSDGSYFGNLCAIDPAPARVSDERTVSMFKLFAELIALQLESEDRQQAAESALSTERETSALREQFIAVLGHDLRSPLSAIAMTGEVLIGRQVQPELVRIGVRLRSAALRMGRLIDDVLDFARGRMGSGMGVVLAEAENLTLSLREVLVEMRTAHPAREFRDRFDIEVPAVCDLGRIQQLLSNLVGNAVVHGAPETPVEVSARVEGDTFVLDVANGGAPIDARNLAHVFEPYWRPPGAKLGGGLGLGLYICAQIADAHGGTLRVTSSHEDGTVFTARLPICAVPGSAQPADPPRTLTKAG